MIEGCWHGEVPQGKQAALLSAGGASQQLVARWIGKGTLDKVAEAWTQGEVVDWQLFHGEDRPPLLHLPTYAFARERYEAAENLAAEAEARAVARVAAESGREAMVGEGAPLVYILQAMAETTLSIERILCAARCHIDSLDGCFLESWIGFERSLGLVWPNTPVAVVLDENEARGASAWLERLWFELSIATPQSILYRNGQRHVSRIQPTVLVQDNGAAPRMGETYLITGGCGRLDLMFAYHLAETRAANLILTGRSALDATKRAAIEQVEGAGGKVLYIQADVCDAAAMTAGLRRARQHLGAIHAESFYQKSSGQRALRAQEGRDLFERILSQGNTHHLVLVGQPERVRGFLSRRSAAPMAAWTPSGPGRRANMKGLTVARCVALDLAELTSWLLQIPRHRLDPEANLADFGFDSISLSEFATILATHFEPAGLGAAITPALPGTSRHEPTAIIGMSGRFPQARNVAEMWTILAQGREAVTEIPADRFDWRLYYGDSVAGKTDGKWSACVPGVREFDPLFFDISPGKRKPWTHVNGCCSRRPGTLWRMQGTAGNSSRPTASVCSLVRSRGITSSSPV